MSVYVITGVSKGLGFEFIRQISENPDNLVVGLVRDKTGTEKKVATKIGDRSNLHILGADLTSHVSLKKAAAATAEIVGDRGVDYLIGNGAFTSQFDGYDPIGKLGDKVEELEETATRLFATNVIGNIHLFNLFLPLVQKSKLKKVIAISSGAGDLDFINDLEVENSPLYAASKAALNAIVAKFNAQYKKEGVLFVAISPGVVEVGHFGDVTEEQMQGLMGFMGKLATYAPHFKGPIPVDEAVRNLLPLFEKVSIAGGHGGAFISHLGNKQWL